MDKRFIAVVSIVVLLLLGGVFGFSWSDLFSGKDSTAANSTSNVNVTIDGEYCTVDEVAAYIKEFHKLPNNYITKKQAQSLGWHGGPLKEYAPGKSIGGDVFTNRQGILPHSEKKYIECDIDANGTSRGAKRIVYSTENYKVYYTSDHYETFKEV